jgi:hypothetical protein
MALARQGWRKVHNILMDIVQEVQMSANDSTMLVESGSQPNWLACSSVRKEIVATCPVLLGKHPQDGL